MLFGLRGELMLGLGVSRRLLEPVAYIDGEGYCGTWLPSDEALANRAATVHGATVKPFGVKLNKINPETKKATHWEKTEGFSVWI